MSAGNFNWFEYLVFGFMLVVSSLTGVYYCIKGGQDTIDGYLFGGKRMSVFPVAMSLVSSFVSGITMIGFPNEIYTYGTQFMMFTFASILATLITVTMIVPVFYKLQLLSVFEYMELRFNSKIRKLCSLLYTICLFSYVPVVMYVPALAVNQVSDIDIHLLTAIVCLVCIFYTTIGGLKAVVCSDTIQGVVMIGSMVVVMVLGFIRIGGIEIVFKNAYEGNRFEFFNLNPDPTVRMSFWLITFTYSFQVIYEIGISPSCVQRFLSLRTLSQAKLSLILMLVGCLILLHLSVMLGLILYSEFKECDPLISQIIHKSDQILPLFVGKISERVPGLLGLFLSGVVCAALSTMSTYLNSASGTIYADFIEPLFKNKPDERHASLAMKILVVFLGVTCTYLATIVEKLGTIVEISTGFLGASSGASTGMFFLGLLIPWANEKGAFAGGLTSLLLMMWIVVGSSLAKMNGQIVHPTKLLSVESCQHSFNLTTQILSDKRDVFYLYKLSEFSYCFIGCMIAIIVGMLVSLVTGCKDEKNLNPDLLSPVIRKYYNKKQTYDAVQMEENKT